MLSQVIYSRNMKDSKVFCKSRNFGTLTTYTMQLETLHIQFSKKQSRILYINVTKVAVCTVATTHLI